MRESWRPALTTIHVAGSTFCPKEHFDFSSWQAAVGIPGVRIVLAGEDGGSTTNQTE